MKISQRTLFCCVGVCALLVLVAVVGPSVLSLYYQEKGGRLLDQVLDAKGFGESPNLWLVPPSIDEPALLAQVQAAQEYFEQAVVSNPKNAQAYRWRGRTALLQGQSVQAVEAFSAYVQLRPQNPLGYWELGLAYERMMEYRVETVYWMFAPAENRDTNYFELAWAPTERATLRAATLQTPAVTIETSYCE
ncbi:MAG: tetratricopeptide repeat protein, partial [Chloroflexota bacterium]|nr:tetratricopeptide repeat protein [Chloroflexota bacterium]